jgi:hypothetical protein
MAMEIEKHLDVLVITLVTSEEVLSFGSAAKSRCWSVGLAMPIYIVRRLLQFEVPRSSRLRAKEHCNLDFQVRTLI